jgi:hypothetical protein
MLTQEQVQAFEDACKPLVKFLCENTNPHTSVIVDCGGAELLSGECAVKIEEFILD